MCNHPCTWRRAVGREHSPEELQCWSCGCWMRVFPASLASACLSGSCWSTDRQRWGRRAVSVYSEGCTTTEVYKQDPNVSPWSVQMLQDKVQSHIDCIIHRPVCSVGLRCSHTGVGCFSKSTVKVIKIVYQLLILQSAGGWCLVMSFHTEQSRITWR